MNWHYSVMFSSSWKSRLSAKTCTQSSTLLEGKPFTSACLIETYLYQRRCWRYVARTYDRFVYLESCTQQEKGLPELGRSILFCQKQKELGMEVRT